MGRLGLSLQQLAEMGIAPPKPALGMPPMAPGLGTPMAPPAYEQPKKPGLGRHIAGTLGDFLLQQGGMNPVYAPMQQQERALEQSEAQWQRRRQAENADWTQRQQWQQQHPDEDAFTRMMRAANIDPASPQGQTMLRGRLDQQAREPDVVVTLPNGQLYIGPKSALGAALGGGAASPPATLPPDFNFDAGGPGGSPSGAGFPP